MRKAAVALSQGAARATKSKRNGNRQDGADDAVSNNSNNENSTNANAGGGGNKQRGGGRKQTAEEAALTAKNYRLAKELVSVRDAVVVFRLFCLYRLP